MAITVSKKKPLSLKNEAKVEAAETVAESPSPSMETLSPSSGPVQTSSYVFPGICAIIATLLFAALLFLQWTELSGYSDVFP
jgi:hypothetical protein